MCIPQSNITRFPPMQTSRQDLPTSWPAPNGVTVMFDILKPCKFENLEIFSNFCCFVFVLIDIDFEKICLKIRCPKIFTFQIFQAFQAKYFFSIFKNWKLIKYVSLKVPCKLTLKPENWSCIESIQEKAKNLLESRFGSYRFCISWFALLSGVYSIIFWQRKKNASSTHTIGRHY